MMMMMMMMMFMISQVMSRTSTPQGMSPINEKKQESVLESCPIGNDDMDVDYQPGNGWRRLDVTVDSGAANSVINGDKHPNIPREESEGSRKGLVYQGPGSERIANREQKKFEEIPFGQKLSHNMTFQDARVRKPLAAVSGITAKDNLVMFDKQGSFIVPANCEESKEIRRLIDRAAGEERRLHHAGLDQG